MSSKKIEISNKSGIPELDAIIRGTSQRFGTDLSGNDYGDIETFTTGSLRFDMMLNGGLPRGRIVEVFGPNSSLKTSLMLVAVAQAQQIRRQLEIEKRDLIIDLEHTLTRSFFEGYGIDMNQIIWERPDSAEIGLSMCIDFAKSGCIDTVLFDSVDAAEAQKEQERDLGDSQPGALAKLMSQSMRRISKLGPKTDTTFLFINQVRSKIGVMYGNPDTTSGGNALPFYASLRLETLSRRPCPDLPGASVARIKLKKTKYGPDIQGATELPFILGRGFDPVFDVVEVAKSLELLRHSAGQTKVWWTSDSEGEPIHPDIGKGKDAALQLLRDDPQMLERLRHTCLRAGGIRGALPDSHFIED